MDRRSFILTTSAAFAVSVVGTASRAANTRKNTSPSLSDIERRIGGRLGVAAIDVHGNRHLEHNAGARFPLCSTFKWLLAAQILARVDRNEEQLERPVTFTSNDLLEYAPITTQHLSEGSMSVSALCGAAIQYSDNTAANLLLATVGGPSGFTAYLRSLGDEVTRLDRIEPELNAATPGDARDTTTPTAMAANLRRILLGHDLTDVSRRRLIDWLVGNTTGAAKLRAGLPTQWRVGDKTGMGDKGSTNDVAIVWPREDRPVLIAAYLTECDAPVSERNGALADVGRLVAGWMG